MIQKEERPQTDILLTTLCFSANAAIIFRELVPLSECRLLSSFHFSICTPLFCIFFAVLKSPVVPVCSINTRTFWKIISINGLYDCYLFSFWRIRYIINVSQKNQNIVYEYKLLYIPFFYPNNTVYGIRLLILSREVPKFTHPYLHETFGKIQYS